MPCRWVHSLLSIISVGSECSFIHELKDKFCIEMKSEHRKLRHELYQGIKILDDGGCTFFDTLEIAMDWINRFYKSYRDGLIEIERFDKRRADSRASILAQYDFHDVLDFVWDDKSSEERRILEAAFREIYLNPKEYSNLFPHGSWVTYFSSKEYENQRDYVASLDYKDVPEVPLKEVLSFLRNLKKVAL